MTRGERRAIRNLAQSFEEFTPNNREAALLIQRSSTGAELLASMISEQLDTAEIVRIARRSLKGNSHAQKVFASFDHAVLCSLGRFLCLAGDDMAFDNGLDVLRAIVRTFGISKLGKSYRGIHDSALLFRGYFDEAAYYINSPEFEPSQYSRFKVALHNPFRASNPQAVSVDEWLTIFNDFASPSGELSPITLNPDLVGLPFDQLWSKPRHYVEGPLVTVVMSSFRRDKTIIGAIQSILNQTWTSLELLVIDDDSGPDYDDLYESIAELDPRIRVIRQRINGGTYLIRNRALTLARGDFMTFQDSDDWSHPERIERQMRQLLDDASIVATQSSCFRTNEHLDPVQVGYPKFLRRNESSLLFRTRAIRRVGFFHYTRKGGDSEFRLRLEAAYGRPVPVIGGEALAIVRLTPGSLSRNEFAPGFRHPRRLIYSQGYSLSHERARKEDTLYRPLHEYSDSFVPAKFRPRQLETGVDKFDVIVVADIRSCANMDEWIISTVEAFHSRGLRVGLAHYVGLRVSRFKVDRISPEVSALYVDGRAEPIDFGEVRRAVAVVVADSAVLQHMPWDSKPWQIDRAYLRRLAQSNSTEEPYDDVSVGYNCRRLFGTRPTWIQNDSDMALVAEVDGLVRETTKRPDAGGLNIVSAKLGFPDSKKSNSRSGTWDCNIEIQSEHGILFSVDDILMTSSPVPGTIGWTVDTKQWCAVLGWPILSYEHPEAQADVAEVLLRAWQHGDRDFDDQYAELGGDCIVIRGDQGDVALRSTVQKVSTEFKGLKTSVQVPPLHSSPSLLGGNCDELVLTSQGTVHRNPLDASFVAEGTPLEEFQRLVNHEVSADVTGGRLLALDDDIDSLLWLGLLRDRIDAFDVCVRSSECRIARFLDAHFIDFSIDESAQSNHCPLSSDYLDTSRKATSAIQQPDLLGRLGASMRGRKLAELVRQSTNETDLLDALWPKLSSVLRSEPASGVLDGSAPTGLLVRKPVWLTSEVQDARHVSKLELSEKRPVRIGVPPYLALNERFPLSAALISGTSARLVISLASERTYIDDTFSIPSSQPQVFPDHQLVIVDTTFAEKSQLDFGWFFGVPGDNLLRRWGFLVKEIRDRLECTEVVVCGDDRTALPAVLLASYLPQATALVCGIEAVAGDSDPEQFARLTELIGNGYSSDDLRSTHDERLCLRTILLAAPSQFRLVLRDDPLLGESGAGYDAARSDRRARVEPSGRLEWLRANAVSS